MSSREQNAAPENSSRVTPPNEESALKTRVAIPGLGRSTALLGSASIAIWVGTGLLFLISWIVEPQSVSHSSLLGMLPFAAILAITAIGQTLVIQQGGIDPSVPGMISITVVIMTRYPNGDSGKVLVALLLAFAVTMAAGLVSGAAISWIGVTPIVATLGMNALLYG